VNRAPPDVLDKAKKDFQERWILNSSANTADLDDFDRIKTLGTGSFGRVMLVRHKTAAVAVGGKEKYCAMKVLDKRQVVKMKQIEHTIAEKKILQEIRHKRNAKI
jgi:protein kinase A